MPARLHTREAIVQRLLGVIRREGYDGASLAQLSTATGLGKGSLYHHFPDGKDDLDSLRGPCPMTTVDPDTLERDPAVLKEIGRRFGGRLALNAPLTFPAPMMPILIRCSRYTSSDRCTERAISHCASQ